MMMRTIAWTVAAASALLAACAMNLNAVEVDEDGDVWVIETDSYTLHFKTAAQAGYDQVFPSTDLNNPDAPKSEMSLFGAGQGRTLYHSHNYAGWKDWGAATDVEEVSNANNTLVMRYEIDDGASKLYRVTATYWDGAPYWKHELVVEAKAPVLSLGSGHEPMVEPRNGQGANNEYIIWEDPFPHVAFANENGYFALYTEVGTVREFNGWGGGDGRMDLVHNDLGVNLGDGDMSEPLVYYMATGIGDLDDAHDLAEVVTEEPSLAVNPTGKLAARWAQLKR